MACGAHFVRREGREHSRRNLQCCLRGVESVEERLLVFLHVLVVRGGQPLEHGEQPDGMPDHTPSLAAEQLERIRVLLLWHE